jgi:hypothetical protein
VKATLAAPTNRFGSPSPSKKARSRMRRSAQFRTTLALGIAASSAFALVALGPACLDDSTTFLCGSTNSGNLQTCDRPGEICDCRTNSCAFPASDCVGGYRYSASPFAQPGLAGQCANSLDPQWIVPAGVAAICPLSEDGPFTFPDAGAGLPGPEGGDGAGSEAGEDGTEANAAAEGAAPEADGTLEDAADAMDEGTTGVAGDAGAAGSGGDAGDASDAGGE